MASDPKPAAGAWADLLPLDGQERVLFVGGDRSRRAAARLRARAGEVVHAPTQSELEPVSDTEWDVVVGEHLAPDDAVALAHRFASASVLALVADNKLSPLARPVRSAWTPRQLTRVADQCGDGTVVFALLRSSDLPTTAFRLDLSRLATVTLEGAAVGAGRTRRTAIRALAALARRHKAQPVVPAWLIVRSDRTDRTDGPTGRMGVAENDQGVVLYGSGPESIEKVYASEEELAAVLEAGRAFTAAGLDVGGGVICQPGPRVLRLRWVNGSVLDANAMPPTDLIRWTEMTAILLGQIHGRTRREDGTVLVHGDFWLGAVVVEGDAISGIIDWTDSYWGDPEADLSTLKAVALSRPDLSKEESSAVIAAADRGYAAGQVHD